MRLRELRLQKGLSITELAEKSGVHRVTISRIEHHKISVKLKTLEKLADALGCSAAELLM